MFDFLAFACTLAILGNNFRSVDGIGCV